MGLAERKVVVEVKETDFKAFEAKVKALCGYDVGIRFDWATLENNEECTSICSNKRYNGYMFDRIIEVFTSVCADSIGKGAVEEKLKSISLIPVAGQAEFSNGILTVRNDLTGNGAYSADKIKTILEEGL